MATNPLKNLGTKTLIAFAVAHGFNPPSVLPRSDDVVYWHPNRKHYIKITLNRKDGVPIPTISTMIESSGLTRKVWRDWFAENRNRKGKRKR